MKASFLLRPGSVELRDIPVPKPKRGELLIKVMAALTCGTDLKAFRRGHPVIPMPGPFGHEFAGIVADVGKGVTQFKAGDAIMAVHTAPCLKCAYCKKGLHNLCINIMDTKVMGAFSEYIVLPEHIVRQNVYPKPKHLPFEEAALLEPLACVVHGIAPLDIKKGDTALVIGSGPIGLMHVMILSARGVQVAATDPKDERLRAAKAFGAKLTKRTDEPLDDFRKLHGGMGFDYVFECTGRPEVWESAVDHPRRGGTVVLFGGCPSGTTVTFDTHRLHYDEITLRGDFHFTPADVKAAYVLLTEGRIKAGKLISGSYSLADIHLALNQLSIGRGIKYAIIP